MDQTRERLIDGLRERMSNAPGRCAIRPLDNPSPDQPAVVVSEGQQVRVGHLTEEKTKFYRQALEKFRKNVDYAAASVGSTHPGNTNTPG